MSAIDGIQARRKRVTWNAPTGLPPKQSFLGRAVPFLSNRFKHPSFLEIGRHGTVMNKWLLNGLDVEMLLAVDSRVLE